MPFMVTASENNRPEAIATRHTPPLLQMSSETSVIAAAGSLQTKSQRSCNVDVQPCLNPYYMKYSITKEKVEINVFDKRRQIFRMVMWAIVFAITLSMALTMPETAFVLYLLALLSLCALSYAYIQSRQKAVFDLVNRKAHVPKYISTRNFDGHEISGFQKVTAPAKSDYYLLFLKKDPHGQGYQIMPRYSGLLKNRNKDVSEFEAKILPVINQIIY